MNDEQTDAGETFKLFTQIKREYILPKVIQERQAIIQDEPVMEPQRRIKTSGKA